MARFLYLVKMLDPNLFFRASGEKNGTLDDWLITAQIKVKIPPQHDFLNIIILR
jgi:hypothetical protein